MHFKTKIYESIDAASEYINVDEKRSLSVIWMWHSGIKTGSAEANSAFFQDCKASFCDS